MPFDMVYTKNPLKACIYCVLCATYSRLMALPLLPAEHIQPAFNNLRDSLPNDVDKRMASLVSYVNDTVFISLLKSEERRLSREIRQLRCGQQTTERRGKRIRL